MGKKNFFFWTTCLLAIVLLVVVLTYEITSFNKHMKERTTSNLKFAGVNISKQIALCRNELNKGGNGEWVAVGGLTYCQASTAVISLHYVFKISGPNLRDAIDPVLFLILSTKNKDNYKNTVGGFVATNPIYVSKKDKLRFSRGKEHQEQVIRHSVDALSKCAANLPNKDFDDLLKDLIEKDIISCADYFTHRIGN